MRMLGNGRPFVVEVLEAREPPTEEVIGRILKHVSEGRGLNEDKDVEVLVLEEVCVAMDIRSCFSLINLIISLCVCRPLTRHGPRCSTSQKRRGRATPVLYVSLCLTRDGLIVDVVVFTLPHSVGAPRSLLVRLWST